MKTLSLIVAIFLYLSCQAQDRPRISFDERSANALNDKCKKQQFKFCDGVLVRRVDGYDYVLIDTSGLFVYIRKKHLQNPNNKYFPLSSKINGYFSESACGEMYELDFFVLKKRYKNAAFVANLKRTPSDEYYKVSESSGMTIINEFYNKYFVKSR